MNKSIRLPILAFILTIALTYLGEVIGITRLGIIGLTIQSVILFNPKNK